MSSKGSSVSWSNFRETALVYVVRISSTVGRAVISNRRPPAFSVAYPQPQHDMYVKEWLAFIPGEVPGQRQEFLLLGLMKSLN